MWDEEPEAKLIVFSSFKATLTYLQQRLIEEDVPCELMHGTVREPRDSILKRAVPSPLATARRLGHLR